jgi:hypothetical protein
MKKPSQIEVELKLRKILNAGAAFVLHPLMVWWWLKTKLLGDGREC